MFFLSGSKMSYCPDKSGKKALYAKILSSYSGWVTGCLQYTKTGFSLKQYHQFLFFLSVFRILCVSEPPLAEESWRSRVSGRASRLPASPMIRLLSSVSIRDHANQYPVHAQQ